MQVLVKWLGYDKPTWEPYANVAKLQLFHEYLQKHNLTKYLQSSFKDAAKVRVLKRTRKASTELPSTQAKVDSTEIQPVKRQRTKLGRQ